MDLLPLALQTLDSREARFVLGDAVQSLPRVERHALYEKVATARGRARHREDEKYMGKYSLRPALPWTRRSWPLAFQWRAWSRAVAAVLLFGEWSRERWPVNNDRDMTRLAGATISGLLAWMPGTTTVTGIDRAAGTIRYEGSPPTLAGVERTSRGEYTVTLASPDEVSRFERGDITSLVDGSFLREPSPEATEDPGSLVALWDREMAVQREAVMRITGWADPPDDEGQGDR